MSRQRELLMGLFISSVTILVLSIPLDITLGLLNLTSDRAHPPNLRQDRRNFEFQYEFATNSRGLRSPEIPLTKPPGRYRILVLGDSFVEGMGVDIHEGFVSLLEERWAKKIPLDMINGGLSGTGAQEYLDLYLEVGRRYQPDAIMLCVYANDVVNARPRRFRRLRKSLRHLWPNTTSIIEHAIRARRQKRQGAFRWRQAAVREAQNRGITQDRIEAWETRLSPDLAAVADKGEFNTSILAAGLLEPDYWTSSLDIKSPKDEARYLAAVSALDEIVALARRESSRFGMVFIPADIQYDRNTHSSRNPWVMSGVTIREGWLTGETEFQRRLSLWAKDRSIPFLDLTEVLRAETRIRGPLTWDLDGHWTQKGNRVAAEAIGRWVETSGVFPFLN